MLRFESGKRGLPVTLALITSGRIPLEQLMRPLRVMLIAVVGLALVGAVVAVRLSIPEPGQETTTSGRPEPGVFASQQAQQGFDPRQLLDQGRGSIKSPAGPHEFYFTRAIYSSGCGYGRCAVD